VNGRAWSSSGRKELLVGLQPRSSLIEFGRGIWAIGTIELI